MDILTILHVAISVTGIASGFIVMIGMLAGKPFRGLTALFLITTIATSLTGFILPLPGFTPAVGVAILSLLVLALAALARYARRMQRIWRAVYIVCAAVALYFNVFVLVVQLFQKVPELKTLAPTQSEPPFLVAQAAVLVLFVALAVAALVRFRPDNGAAI